MSTETLAHSTDHETAVGEHAHPDDKKYIVVALVLGFFTAIEVLTYFVDFGGAAVPTLIALMIIKFALVILYFMHLRFDSAIYMRLFVSGLVLAIGVYFAMLASFEIWN